MWQNQQLRKELDDAQKAQTMLVERLISCCKEVRNTPPPLPLPSSPAFAKRESEDNLSACIVFLWLRSSF